MSLDGNFGMFSQNQLTQTWTDSDFEDVCKELESPQVEGWEYFTESHGVTIYRLYNEVRTVNLALFIFANFALLSKGKFKT